MPGLHCTHTEFVLVELITKTMDPFSVPGLQSGLTAPFSAKITSFALLDAQMSGSSAYASRFKKAAVWTLPLVLNFRTARVCISP